ncbi:serine/threonine-protein kinase [Nitriliruptor alkaliphilus]|uniref:serine/threonine-protein kinase n=1 Tax=Nitriliruptor alkaliphilus TaxID=427918 RepID=UPI000696BED3|nr:serine/threonine-protein kinase [Nitriliruptor alkaliphilus]
MASTTDRRVGGRYELMRRIARGGGGTVWAGYDHLLERDVAVKHVMIPDDLPEPERELLRARVRSEARAAARLLHPSAVTIFDVIAEDGDVHLVLELVDDPTLDELVAREGPLPEADVAVIGLRMLDVLVAAHERGIVHRDVKPSNIFVSDEGEVKLTDFGIASMDGEARLTRTGATMGSPQFIAPEQALGHDAAPAADLWGLGASLYLAVEGVPPFERSNAVATVHAVVHEDARPMERAVDLAPLLSRLLEKRPEDRPDERWLRGEFARLAGVDTPPVAAEDTAVVPIRSTPVTEPTPHPTDEGGGEEDDSALTASVAVPPAAPSREDDAAPAADDRADRRWVPAAAVLALIVIVGFVMLTRLGGDDPGRDDEQIAAPDETDEATTGEGADPDADAEPDPDGADGDGSEDDAEVAAENAVPEAEVPDDWQTIEGPAYQVAVPAGWEVEQGQGRIIDHRDPDSSTYLRVDWTPEPLDDPFANWEAQDAALAGRFEDYERQQLAEVTFRGQPAALLEYTYTAGGTQLRAYNLNIRYSDDRAYALNLQSRADDWDEVEPMFASMVGGFQPDG